MIVRKNVENEVWHKSMYLTEDRIDKGLFPYEPGSPDAMIHNDHLATPQKMTDGTGTVVWSADYKPFGEATVTTTTITNNLRFPGHYFDAETGVHYNYYRDYVECLSSGHVLDKHPSLFYSMFTFELNEHRT